MKIRGRTVSKWVWIPSVVAAGLVAVYLARWPVFGGVIRGQLDQIVGREFLADVDVEQLEGSLVSSIRAQGVRLRPRQGSPFRRLTIDRVDVSYGLFGLSTPKVKLKGVRAALSISEGPSAPSTTPHKSIRDLLRALPTFELPVEIRLRDGQIELANGMLFTVERAALDDSEWTVVGAAPIFGPFHAVADFHRKKESVDLRVSAGAGEGNRVALSGSLGRRLDLHLTADLIPPESLKGRLAADIRLTGTPARPELNGWARLKDLSYQSASPVSLELDLATKEGVLEILGGSSTPYGEIAVDGRIPVDEDRFSEDLRVVVRLTADELAPLRARVADPDELGIKVGRLTATVEIGGPISAPTWTADARIRADILHLPSPLGPVRDINLKAGFESGRLQLSELTATLGYGPFRASGHWEPYAPGRPLRLEIKGRNLLVVDDSLVRVRLNPDLVITKTDEASWTIQGSVAVPLAIIHSEFVTGRIEGREPEEKTTPLAAPGYELRAARGGGFILPGAEGGRNIALDLKITAPGEVRIENRTLGVLLEGDLEVRGTAARPIASGVVRARRGEVKVGPGIFIQIVSGRIRLPKEPGKTATVRLVGRVGSGDGAIRIIADGPLESPDLDLRSDPPRRDDEILSYLAFGRWPGELGGGSALGILALEAFDQFSDSMPKADRKESLIDKLHPTIVPEEEEERRAPWELPAAGTGRGFMLRTEYTLNRHFSVILESDREGNVRGNLKLRYRF
jgi:hypothetical protein